MNFVSFASGSSGNCCLVTEGRTAVLIDAGISLRRIKAGLARRALTPDDLSAVLITHGHSDHTVGLAMLLKNHKKVKKCRNFQKFWHTCQIKRETMSLVSLNNR